MNTLKQVSVAKRHGDGALKRRIIDMGLTKDVEVTIFKVGTAGRPHRGYSAVLCASTPQG